MYLIQLLLPVRDNQGQDFPSSPHDYVRKQLAEKFGGITAYIRTPAKGIWKDRNNEMEKDDIFIFEIMLKEPDEAWWRDYKQALEKLFSQEDIIIRVLPMRLVGESCT
jgi:hypothetical protein